MHQNRIQNVPGLNPAWLHITRTDGSRYWPRDLIEYSQSILGACGGVEVKALRYKPTGRGFDSRWCNWNFSVT
jgi:hypothetical protein